MSDNREEYFVSKFDDLMTSFKNRDLTDINYILNRNVSEIFPEDYAGAYFSDNSELNLFVTDECKNDLYKSFFASDSLRIHKVRFSLSELIDAQYSLLKLGFKNIITYVSQSDNKVIIIGETEKVIFDIKNKLQENGLDLSMYNFSIDCIDSEDTSAYMSKSGDGVANPFESTVLWGTVGFNVYDPINKKNGIVTAGHLCDNGATYLYDYDKSHVIGSVKKKIIDSNVDCLYVEFAPPGFWQPTNLVYNYLSKQNEGAITKVEGVSSLLEGTEVRKFGITSGMNTGKIISAYFSVDELVNHIYCSNYNDYGDSGGPIGKWNSRTMTLYGITRRKLKVNNYTIACKAAVVLSELGLSLYR